MKFSRDSYLKWIESKHPQAAQMEFKLNGACLGVARNNEGHAVGLTVFEPGQLTEEVAQRLIARAQSQKTLGRHFEFIVPPFFERRAQSFLGAEVPLLLTPFCHARNAGGFFTLRNKLRVALVDDSPVILKLLAHTMQDMGFIEVVAQISDPTSAVQTIVKARPDVITLDMQMPRMTGVEVLRQLLAHSFFPVVVVSSVSLEDGSLVFQALKEGAFDYLQKPKFEERGDFNEMLERALLAASGATKDTLQRTPVKTTARLAEVNYPSNMIWTIGASTGGTQALTEILRGLPGKIPPTLVVQHIPPVFSKAFADSLNSLCPFTVKEAEHGEVVSPDHVYIAPGGQQMGVVQSGGVIRIAIRDDEPVNRFKPSVDYLFKEVECLKGVEIVAGLLTGMGRDGAAGLLQLRQKGAATVVQDEATSAVFGMPRAALELNAADHGTPLDRIAQEFLRSSTRERKAA